MVLNSARPKTVIFTNLYVPDERDGYNFAFLNLGKISYFSFRH